MGGASRYDSKSLFRPEIKCQGESIGPRDQRLFFGALDHHKLSFAERMMVKAVRAPEGDFRDWQAIEAWAASIARDLL
jgi:menaquinone-dependent protoporphyrinogen oxidase